VISGRSTPEGLLSPLIVLLSYTIVRFIWAAASRATCPALRLAPGSGARFTTRLRLDLEQQFAVASAHRPRRAVG
jgi:hypothetical protein